MLLPPFGWGDEVPHFLRAHRVSHGDLRAVIDHGRRGGFVPSGVSRLIRGAGLTAVAWDACSLSPGQLRALFDIQATHGARPASVFMQEFGAPYPPIASVHSAPAVLLARSVTGRVVLWLYAARLASLVVWLGLVAVTMQMAPSLRTTLVALCLTPTALFLAATCSADGLLDAVAFLWAAYVLALCRSDRPSPSLGDTAVVLCFALTLGVVKLVYAPLILLLALVPAGGRRATWRSWAVLLSAAVMVGGLGALGWVAVSGGSATEAVVFGGTPAGELDPMRVLTDPARTLLALPNTAAAEWYPWLVNIAWPKFTRCMQAHSIAVPLVWGAVLAALALDGSAWRPTVGQRLVGIAVFACVFCTAVIVALATWTPAGHDRAIGVHARYFLPALPALAIALLPPLGPLKERTMRLLHNCVLIGVIAANVLVLIAFLRQYDWSA